MANLNEDPFTRDLRAKVAGLEAALRMKEISFCQVQVEYWRERWERSAAEVEIWKKKLHEARLASEDPPIK